MKIAHFDFNEGKTFIIAELSANHNQDFNLAKKAVKLAYEAGADAIKLQTYTADSLTIDVKEERFKAGHLWSSEYLYDLYERAHMPMSWHEPLKAYADELGIILFSSAFDISGADLLESLNVPAYKIASFEITDIPLIQHVAAKRKPILISTGIANEEDILRAIEACRSVGNNQIALLKCTSSYPAPPESMNLSTIPDMAQKFGVTVGLSDHTLGLEACIAGVALGAKIIEKHFTPDPSVPSADQAFSLSPDELTALVKSIRSVEKMIGYPDYKGGDKKYARSLFAIRDIAEGEKFTAENTRSIRPGEGLHPRHLNTLLHTHAITCIKRGTPLDKTMVSVKLI
ncbi:pseudaminic acid synthase [Sulfuricurvum sp.]|uniref:pseudaminic acid synthase n=1 Tax=Sulfuricurvum sp. TaxID=2025608 RepID=UPI0026227CF7|nr:pseudaminic acid synthase [Sulfuricurvum sp.]MDD2780479.1 pseudaminic acid synthase [Sulfuricurvum sp.]